MTKTTLPGAQHGLASKDLDSTCTLSDRPWRRAKGSLHCAATRGLRSHYLLSYLVSTLLAIVESCRFLGQDGADASAGTQDLAGDAAGRSMFDDSGSSEIASPALCVGCCVPSRPIHQSYFSPSFHIAEVSTIELRSMTMD